MNAFHRWLCRSGIWKTALEQSMVPWVLEDIELGDHVLEIGPGPGLTTDLLRSRVPQMTALEIDSRLADSLKQRMANTNVRVIEGDATDMPFENQQFSAVVSFTMLHHVPSAALQDQLLTEAYRVLRTGGVFAGLDSIDSPPFRFIHIGDTLTIVDPDTFSARLAVAGFVNVRLEKKSRRFRFRAWRDA